MRIARRELLQGAALATSALAFGHGGPVLAAPDKPNIIFILADDLGYGDLGCFGQQQILTPNLDRMAIEGTRFTQCYAGSTVCAPSRCCLMTGYHTGHAYIRGNARLPLRPQDLTVAELLKTQGYKTALIGKWGLGNENTTGEPRLQGFDYSFGYLDQGHAHNYYPEKLIRNGAFVTIHGNKEDPPGIAVERKQYSHDLFMQDAYDFVEANKANPFFLYLALTIPHANDELGGKTGNGMEVPDDAPYTGKDWPQVQKNKAAMITRMDDGIGKLFKQLTALGIDDNTLVVFTSDNGPHHEGGVDPTFFDSSGPLRGTKRDLYEGGVRVPGIARWPGHVPAGATSDRIWAFWDVLPTLCELTGATAPKGIDGISMLPAILGQPQSQQHEFLYWEFHERGSKQAVRCGDWKGVRFYGGAFELYNLKDDLAETKDVSSEHPDVAKKLQDFIDGARTETADWALKPAPTK